MNASALYQSATNKKEIPIFWLFKKLQKYIQYKKEGYYKNKLCTNFKGRKVNSHKPQVHEIHQVK